MLHVEGAGATLVLNTTTTGNPAIIFGNNTGGRRKGYIFFDTDDDIMTLNYDGSNAGGVHIDNSNNIGIGDTSPTEALLVVGSAGASDIYSTLSTSGTTNDAICWDASGATLMYDCDSTPADIAEYSEASEDVVPGDVVALYKNLDINATPYILKKASISDQSNIAGVISTDPYQAFGEEVLETAKNPRLLSLVGRVPVKVNLENGPIQVGDLLTLSNIPGQATKLIGSGIVIGRALESYSGTEQLMGNKISEQKVEKLKEKARWQLGDEYKRLPGYKEEMTHEQVDELYKNLKELLELEQKIEQVDEIEPEDDNDDNEDDASELPVAEELPHTLNENLTVEKIKEIEDEIESNNKNNNLNTINNEFIENNNNLNTINNENNNLINNEFKINNNEKLNYENRINELKTRLNLSRSDESRISFEEIERAFKTIKDVRKYANKLRKEAALIESDTTPKLLVFLNPSMYAATTIAPTATSTAAQNNIFYSGTEFITVTSTQSITEIGYINITKINETNNETYTETTTNTTTTEITKEIQQSVPNDFSFRAGNENNYKELLTINATTEEVRIKKLKVDVIEADRIIGISDTGISKVNGSVIVRLG